MAEAGSSTPSDGAAVEELRRRHAEIDELRERIMNVVGHALRTPMATLRGQVEVVVTDPDRVRDPAFRESLVRSAERLEWLLDDLLVASGVETTFPVADPRPLGLVDELRAAIAELPDPQAVVLELHGAVGARVRVAPDGLRWILLHLARNALGYGGPGMVATVEESPERVMLRLDSPDARASEDELANAFEMFYRGEHAVMAAPTGLGVGLPVARRLAEQAGGSLRLERSVDGAGVTAVLEVPSA